MKSAHLSRLPSLASFRSSILAALGLAACGGQVVVPEGSGGSGNSTGSSSSSSGMPAECAGAMPVPAADGSPSGFARCPDGTVHRVQPVACNPDAGITPCTGKEVQIDCMDDSACGAMPHGHCVSTFASDFGGTHTACSCVYPCANDAECGAGKVCVCGGVALDHPFSFCASAGCAGSADCASGECGLSVFPNGCYDDVELACRNPGDACRADGDCDASLGQKCVVPDSPANPWACLGTTCAIGRPLLVEGEARTAAPAERADWIAPGVAPGLAGLDRETREQIAAHWLQVGALEHASVASFARFSLELLALAAPASLLADAQRAGLDEVDHARVAYAVASAYAGRKLGPDALDLGSVAVRTDRREVIRSLIVEGCVGETLGVAEAIELAARVRDPALRRAHARIAADEQRHAELAWRTLAWLLAGEGEETARFAARCFAEASAATARDPEAPALALPEHGLLAAEDIGAVRRRALADVVAPCAAALLARPAAPARAEVAASA
jgi:hypothetical protein